MGESMLGAMLPVTVVLGGLLVVAIWLRRRLDHPALGQGGRSVRLTAEHAVHVVNVEGRRWMIGTGPAGSPTLLAELPPSLPSSATGAGVG